MRDSIFKIRNLRFVETSIMCPEQYDVYNENNQAIGYVRLRFGELTARLQGEEEPIYLFDFEEEYLGEFPTDDDFEFHMDKIVDAFIDALKR